MVDVTKEILDAIPKPNRIMAPVQYYGGKGHLVKRIMPYIPRGTVYVEPFCGAASVFWHLTPPRKVEVLNDLYGELITLYRVLQDKKMFDKLAHKLCWTPYSRAEFSRALEMESNNPVGIAWAFFVKCNQGFTGRAKSVGSWSRAFTSNRGAAQNASSFRGRLACLYQWHDRLSRVQLDNRDAIEVIEYWDSDDTVFYIDPPYMAETRLSNTEYKYEMTNADHERLIDVLLDISGQAAVSGYACPTYERLADAGWTKHEFQTSCNMVGRVRRSKLRGKGAATKQAPRTECLWVHNLGPRGFELL